MHLLGIVEAKNGNIYFNSINANISAKFDEYRTRRAHNKK